MLLTHYCEEAAAEIPETLFFMYEECVHLGVNQEETYFRLARYYDRLLMYYMANPQLCASQADEKDCKDPTQRFSQSLMSGDTKEEVYTKLMEHSIVAFGNSLKYGVRYLRESMPRLLNLWYDLGSTKGNQSLSNTSRTIKSRIHNTIRFIDELKSKSLPPYYFMTAISLLLSRISHPHSGYSKTTNEILELLLTKYPQQVIWHLIAVLKDSENPGRAREAKNILTNVAKGRKLRDAIEVQRLGEIKRILQDTISFSDKLRELCSKAVQKTDIIDNHADLKEISSAASKFEFSETKIIAPIQSAIRPILPIDNFSNNLSKHIIFPDTGFHIRGIDTKVKIFNSQQKPKQVTLKLENGRSIGILCKKGDDLRKDSRCIEFFDLLNRILRRNSQSNARFFEIKTFLVLPLDKDVGILEMVPNLTSLKGIVDNLYKERLKKDLPNYSNYFSAKQKELNLVDLHNWFNSDLVTRHKPAVLPTWFLRRFTEPISWYMARLAFTRTSAVISMGGYIIGLGDRHLDNILIDVNSGKIVHVDFNLLFHQGEDLAVPERVPFRLTHNLVAAFGSIGTEGNFRKASEITMRVMRSEKDALLTTLKPFMHDPCSEWTKDKRTENSRPNKLSSQSRDLANQPAKIRIEVTERKLKGFPRSKAFKPLTLIDSYSVEAQVDSLIEEASDTHNLCQMYFGWAPFI